MKRIPIGLSDFKHLIEEDFYYFDKTAFIEEVIKDGYAQFCEFSKKVHQNKKNQNEQAKQALEVDFISIENEIKEGKIFETNEANIRRALQLFRRRTGKLGQFLA